MQTVLIGVTTLQEIFASRRMAEHDPALYSSSAGIVLSTIPQK